MEISRQMVEYIAVLSRLKLGDRQAQQAQAYLHNIIDYMDSLNRLDTSNVTPLSHLDTENVMRADTVRASYDRQSLLINAPEHTEETLVVPKTVE